MNKTIISGRLTKNIELRTTNGGQAVTSFTLAVNRGFKSADGVEADFISCTAWGKTAELLEKYCCKGSHILIEGRINTRNYDGKDGNKVYVTEVQAERVEFLDSKKDKEATSKGNDFDTSFASVDVSMDDIQF